MVNKIKKIVNNLKTPGGTLSQKVVKGGFWVFFLRIVSRGLSLIRLIILARILSPNDFGLMGIALLTMSILETFSQTGFQQALIQKKEDIKPYLDSAWTVLILRGFALFIILYFIAPYAAIFFDAPEAKAIIRVIGFAILFKAFTNIGVTYFQKELEFNKEFIYQFSGTLADFVVAISAVLILRNVWALVLGLLTGNMVRCFVSYFIHPYKPHLSSDLKKIKELFGFGKWIMGGSILYFMYNQGDDVFLGKFMGASALGLYQIAYRISNLPATEITHVISQVTFPAYSKLQEKLPQLRKAYLQTLQFVSIISIPFAGVIAFMSSDFTRLFLGERWIPMVPAMQVLVIWGLIRSIGANSGPLFKAVGRPDLGPKLQTMKVILLVILIYPLTVHWGILGTSLAVLSSALIVYPMNAYLTIKIIKCKTSDFVRILVIPIVMTLLMLGALFFLRFRVFEEIKFLSFFLLIAIGIAIYLSLVLVTEHVFNFSIRQELLKIFSVGVKNA